MDYMANIIEKIIVERNKSVDSAILGEIQQIAVENGIETKIILNEKNVADAFRKQIPQKPIDDRFPWAICPTCGGSIWLENVMEHIQCEEASYCEHCGQAIDWHRTEGE